MVEFFGQLTGCATFMLEHNGWLAFFVREVWASHVCCKRHICLNKGIRRIDNEKNLNYNIQTFQKRCTLSENEPTFTFMYPL